jgi:hypothetical protein
LPSEVAPATVAAGTGLPAAVETLRRVAKNAGYEEEARRAMALDAERFATLISEEKLDHLPEATGFQPAEVAFPAAERSRPALPEVGRPSGSEGTTRNSASSVPSEGLLLAAFTPLV